MFKTNHISLPLLLSGITSLSANAQDFVDNASADAPNLIFFIADQLRFDALSCNGNKIISTPNMDRLAAEGVNFTRAYAQSPVSVPSRASMLTGNSLCNTGIWGNGYDYEVKTGSLITGNEPIFKTKTYDEALAENGYTCEYYGKWHSPERKAYVYANRPVTCAGKASHPVLGLGLSDEYARWWKSELNITTAPTQPGALTGGYGKLNYMPDALDARVINPSLTTTSDFQRFGKLLISAEHSMASMDAINVIDAIERNKSKRFSIHCSFDPPHPPFVVASPYYGSLNPANLPFPTNYFVNSSSSNYYRASELNSPYYAYSIAKMGAFQNPATFRIFVARYYEMVKEIDDKLGEILKKLDDEGLTDKTMIVFCGDHGEMLGSHGMNSKNNFYDESARVPMIIRYPAKIAAGKRVTVPINNIDLRPTVDDYLNMPAYKCDGKSLRPFIEDTYNKNETYFAVSEWYSDKIPGFMVRTDNHKLMIAHTAEAKNTAIDGFYNLKTDSLELINILKTSPVPSAEMAKAQELKVLLVKWLKKVNSPYYFSVKARPLGRLNANYTLYQNDIAKIKIPGITNLTGLPAGMSFKILSNDTIQITTSSSTLGLIGTTATISGGSTQVRFEVLAAIDYTTAIPVQKTILPNDFSVSATTKQLVVTINHKFTENINVRILNVDGKVLINKSLNSKILKFDTSNLSTGCYFVQLIQGNYKTAKKFIIP